jgi:hypothetical protein
MIWKTTIPIGASVFLAVVVASVVGAAIFLSDQGEELVHLYGDYAATQAGGNRGGDKSGRMELMGRWRGVNLVALGSPTAGSLGVGDADGGVVVADAPAGVGPRLGDVITRVDNQPVNDLTDFYNATTRIPSATPVVMEVKRQGQTVALVLPPAARSGAGNPGDRAEVENPWGAGVPAAWRGGNFYCPRDGTVLPGDSISSPYLCPRCRGALHTYPPRLR